MKKQIERPNRYLYTATNKKGKSFDLFAFQVVFDFLKKYFDMAEFRKVWTSCGLPEEYVGNRTKKGTISLAIAATVKEMQDKSFVYKKVGDETNNLEVHNIYRQYVNKNNGKLEGEMVEYARITYNAATEHIECNNQELSAVLDGYYRFFLLNYTTADVSRYAKTCFEREATLISLRSHGGVYIVPAKDHETVLKFKKLFDTLDPEGDFHITELPDLDSSKEAVAAAAENKTEKIVEELRDKLAKMKNKNHTMSKTIKNGLFDDIIAMGKELELITDIAEYELITSKDLLDEITQEVNNYKTAAQEASEKEESK